MKIDSVLNYASSFIGVPYIYGGNNPLTGWDCSGFTCEILKAFGVIHYSEDLNAQALFFRLVKNSPLLEIPVPGSIVFFGKDRASIIHVGLALSPGVFIESGGGDSVTNTRQMAELKGAFTRIRPLRKDFVGAILPEYRDVEK